MTGKWWIVTAVSLFIGSLFAGKSPVSGVNIDVLLVDPPVVEYKSGRELSPKTVAENRWLMIKVEYSVRDGGTNIKPQLMRSAGRYTLARGGFVDDLQFGIRVLQNTGISIAGKPLWGMYTGRTAFYTVRMDGKKHLLLMFIPGKLIDRYSCSASGGIRKVSKDDFKVEVRFSVGGRECFRKYRGVAGNKEFDELTEMVPVNMIVPGGVFTRSRTPWAFLGADNFDVETDFPEHSGK